MDAKVIWILYHEVDQENEATNAKLLHKLHGLRGLLFNVIQLK